MKLSYEKSQTPLPEPIASPVNTRFLLFRKKMVE